MTTPANQETVTTTFWYKELWGNKFLIEGRAVEFEQLEGNRGILSLPSNDSQIPALEKAAKDQIGGIVKISQDEYEKKRARFPLQEKRPELLEVAPRADRPTGKAFRPPPPKESPPSPAPLVDGENRPALPPLGEDSQVPQQPPDRPDFTAEGKAAKFAPKTTRAGIVKPPEPTPV